jgi:beta-glucosidase
MLKQLYLLSGLFIWSVSTQAQQKTIAQKVDSVLQKMTLTEKIGQLNQYSGDWAHTGPITPDGDKQNQIRRGEVGSMLNVMGVEHTRMLQELAMQSRLKIPLLYGQDVIHGFRTTFPIPLAQSCSWDLAAIEKAERIAGTEAAASGIHWTFSPMVDIARDARWGRVMEGSGEDPYLGSRIAAARVRGFQGKGLGHTDAVMACVKHFAAYGAAVAGRDYNDVDISDRSLWQYYLPPFKAAVDAGVASVMTAFNDINGIPATGNRYLLQTVLNQYWHFTGLVVSDWGSVGGMTAHGFTADDEAAAKAAIEAGCHMDMESRAYKKYLVKLVNEKKLNTRYIDDAVKRVLRKKFELGLFDDPFKFCDEKREAANVHVPEYLEAARDLSRKSIVLLKNDNHLLPLSKQTRNIAFIGPFAKAVRDNLGFWSMEWPDDSATIVTQWNGVRKAMALTSDLYYAKGCNINDTDSSGFAEAIAVAAKADVVILSLGEARDMSGEAKSRSNIQLPGVQEQLIRAVMATGKPVVLLINAGRPLVFSWAADHVPAIVYTWWLGSQAGNAIADVLFGDYNPSGKLTMSFPRSVGQVPIYYNHQNTGHPAPNDSTLFYVTGYIDLLHSPRYPFGYGLSYASFAYSDLKLNKDILRIRKDSLDLAVTISNTGTMDGTETVQLYLRDMAASVARPVKELIGFQQVLLHPGETKTIHFTVSEKDCRFYNQQLKYISEPGTFKLMVGGNSRDVLETSFELN